MQSLMGETPKTAQITLLPITYYRLDAVAHGGNPQDRANHAITHYLLPITLVLMLLHK
ncbi:hypothetical protein [Moorena producens]|uniref:hypothetical protein n=1 Tax=Moorena producens TaxID=1155739 RepID=UPI001E416D93|nr:hypothetical protein [Moorena producens]